MDILSDQYLFPLLLISLLAFTLYAAVRNAAWQRPGAIKRGDISRQWFYWFFGFASVVITQVINATEALKSYTVLVNVLCLGALMHLIFFNGWFRNILLGYKARYEKRIE